MQKDGEKELLEKQSVASKPSVALSTYALYDAAQAIAGDKIDTFMILPFGVDAHSFEPTPKQVAKIQNAKLVVYSGVGLEPWVGGFHFEPTVLDMSQQVALLEVGHHCSDEKHNEETQKDKDHQEHHKHVHHEGIDPHYWLSIENMITVSERLAKEFSAMLPQHAEVFEQNKQNYIEKLQALAQQYKQTLASCKQDTLIVNHNAFAYLGHHYKFHIEALTGLSPQSQPNPKVMIELIEHVKREKVNTVFFESFVSDKAMQAIANEAEVEVDVLQPLGNITKKEYKEGKNYIAIMKTNLKKIAKALECH